MNQDSADETRPDAPPAAPWPAPLPPNAPLLPGRWYSPAALAALIATHTQQWTTQALASEARADAADADRDALRALLAPAAAALAPFAALPTGAHLAATAPVVVYAGEGLRVGAVRAARAAAAAIRAALEGEPDG